jgi:hypothetical protein
VSPKSFCMRLAPREKVGNTPLQPRLQVGEQGSKFEMRKLTWD